MDEEVPRCEVKGCSNPAAWVSYRKDGSKMYRRRADTGYVCVAHHQELTGASQGLTARQWVIKDHPYLKHRKEYCENQDGRLGYVCTSTIVHSVQLDVDHVDGNPYNHDPSNLQTLCKCCHAYKSIKNGDYKTPGRKKIIDAQRTERMGILFDFD